MLSSAGTAERHPFPGAARADAPVLGRRLLGGESDLIDELETLVFVPLLARELGRGRRHWQC